MCFPLTTAPVRGPAAPADAGAALADAGLPGDIAAAVLTLADRPDDLATAWDAYRTARSFAALVTSATGRDCVVCSHCDAPTWEDDASRDVDDEFVCATCATAYTACDRCDALHRWADDLTYVGGDRYCARCRDDHASFCEHCEEWYLDVDEDDHEHDPDPDECGCDAPHWQFRFPANGAGSVGADDRLRVELPAGVIDDAGIESITRVVSLALAGTAAYEDVASAITALDPRWQTERGNYTRRLSAELYRRHATKLPPGVLADVGNAARRHTTASTTWLVELTRDLNQPPDAFYNEGSCWWGDSATSRCALKSWGGLALRSYAHPDHPAHCPSGRAWVQPLDADLTPTHDTTGAAAYLVYNGYGQLAGYAAARLVAHLTSRTYRKVSCQLSYQFVNGNTAYLVADQQTCERVDRVDIRLDPHDRTAADRLLVAVAA